MTTKAKRVQVLGGPTSTLTGFTGRPREIIIDTSDWAPTVHDGLNPGGHKVQLQTARLSALLGVSLQANKLIYATGADTVAATDLTAFARSLLAGVDAAAIRGLLSTLATNGDGSAVAVTATGGTTALSLAAWLGVTTNVKAFGAVGDGRASDATAIAAAIAATPTGGVLYLPAGRYQSPDLIDRSDITIVGQGMPWFSSDGLSLTGGTILLGRTVFSGDRLTIENIGVDCGATVCAALYAGSGRDALVVHDKDLSKQRTNVKVKNVIGLTKSGVAYHSVLLEGLTYSHFENVHGRGGNYGVVIKASDSDGCGIYGYGGAVTGIYIKSDSYAPCARLSLTNLYADDAGALTAGSAGVSLFAATAQMERVNVSNVFVKGYQSGLKLVGANRANYPTNAINDVSVSNAQVQGSSTYGIETYGALVNVGIGGARIAGVVSNNPVYIQDDALLVSLQDVSASVLTDRDDAVYLGGRVFWDNIVATKTYDATQPAGITVKPDATSKFSVGNYTGRLKLVTGVTEGLLNGWATFGGDTPKVTVRGKVVRMSGRISVPSTPWTGKENAYQLPIAPARDKNILAGAYNSATNSFVVIQARITTGGALRFDGLNVSAQFPTGVTWVDLTGSIEFDLDD